MSEWSKHYAFLPGSDPSAERLGNDIVRLATPRGEYPTSDLIGLGEYLRTTPDGTDYLIRALIVDGSLSSEIPPSSPRFKFGIDVDLLAELSKEEGQYTPSTPKRSLERITISGGRFENLAAKLAEPGRSTSQRKPSLPLRVDAQLGEAELIDMTLPGFDGRDAVKALIGALYLRFRIESFSPKNQFGISPKEEISEVEEPGCDDMLEFFPEPTDDDAPDDHPLNQRFW